MAEVDDLDWIDEVVGQFPEVRPLFDDHRDFNHEVLTHLFMGDVARWAITRFENDPSDPVLGRLLDELDLAYVSKGSGVQNIIALSFVENLGWDSPLLDLLGPNLTTVAREIFPAHFRHGAG